MRHLIGGFIREERCMMTYWLRVFGQVAFGRKAMESLTLRRIARADLRSCFFGGQNGESRANAGHSDGTERRAVPAICLAPSDPGTPWPSAQAVLAYPL